MWLTKDLITWIELQWILSPCYLGSNGALEKFDYHFDLHAVALIDHFNVFSGF